MSDILERLRVQEREGLMFLPHDFKVVSYGEAAGEIARLRTSLSEAEQQLKSLDRLRDVTYAVQHNPNCPAKYLVRLVGKSGRIDFKPYGNGLPRVKHETTDILGFGKTLGEAIDNALATAPALIPSEPHDAEGREG